MCRSGRVQVCVFPAGFGSNFRIMVGSASGPGSTFKAFLGSARVRVPLSNKIRVRVGSVQHIYGSLRVRVQIFGPVKTSTMIIPCILVLSVLFDFVWSTSYSPVFLSVSALPCLALPCLELLKTIIWVYILVSVFLYPPRVCTMTLSERQFENKIWSTYFVWIWRSCTKRWYWSQNQNQILQKSSVEMILICEAVRCKIIGMT